MARTFTTPRTWVGLMCLCTTLIAAHTARAAEAPPAPPSFDLQRHMRVAEVRPGMSGFGLSVFKGTRIERFDVEVLSVLRNFNPKGDVVLIKCQGANLEHTGSIAGMSGSPIYLRDDHGRDRLIGAFAYGWPLMKDPVAGVQPIEYMLRLPTDPATVAPATQPATQKAHLPVSPMQATLSPRWSLADVVLLPGMTDPPPRYPLAGWGVFVPNPRLDGPDEPLMRLRPLATPLMTVNLPPRLLDQFGPIFRAYGLVPLQAGAAATSAPAGEPPAPLEPGAVMAVPLLTGDVEMTAIGTCTEVVGDRVYGFGHAFTSEGPITLPMGSGRVHAVIANLMTSFKIGSLTQLRGAIHADQTSGLAGRAGDAPAAIPIDLRVTYADGTQDLAYHFSSAAHPKFTPLISALAMGAAIAGARDLPQYHTLDYDLLLEFANGQTIRIINTAVNAEPAELFFDVGTPIMAAVDNPFERVMLKKVSGTVHVIPEAREAKVLSVNVPREKYRPGEIVKAYVTYRPFRAAEATLPVELELPRDLPDGSYQLVIADWQRFVSDERTAKPFRFTAQNIDEVFAVLRDVMSIRHDALYMRLLRQADGVAIGRAAMPHLPSSRRQVLLNAGRSNTTAFVSSTVKIVPTPLVMEGDAEFTITIDKDAKVELGGAKPSRHEPKEPPAAPGQKPEEPKPKSSKGDPAAPPKDNDGRDEREGATN